MIRQDRFGVIYYLFLRPIDFGGSCVTLFQDDSWNDKYVFGVTLSSVAAYLVAVSACSLPGILYRGRVSRYKDTERGWMEEARGVVEWFHFFLRLRCVVVPYTYAIKFEFEQWLLFVIDLSGRNITVRVRNGESPFYRQIEIHWNTYLFAGTLLYSSVLERCPLRQCLYNIATNINNFFCVHCSFTRMFGNI